jgi:hypothetical protein
MLIIQFPRRAVAAACGAGMAANRPLAAQFIASVGLCPCFPVKQGKAPVGRG